MLIKTESPARGNVKGFESTNQRHTDDTPLAGNSTCPHFDKCSAPLCPLDADWRKRHYLDGEAVCRYMLALAKPNGRANLSPTLSGVLLETLSRYTPAIISRYGGVRRRLQRASTSGSRMERRLP